MERDEGYGSEWYNTITFWNWKVFAKMTSDPEEKSSSTKVFSAQGQPRSPQFKKKNNFGETFTFLKHFVSHLRRISEPILMSGDLTGFQVLSNELLY